MENINLISNLVSQYIFLSKHSLTFLGYEIFSHFKKTQKKNDFFFLSLIKTSTSLHSILNQFSNDWHFFHSNWYINRMWLIDCIYLR